MKTTISGETKSIAGGRTGSALMTTAYCALFIGLALSAPAAWAQIEQGRQKADEVCAACHGKDGNTPIDPSYPRLAGQHRDYLEQALLDYQSEQRKNPIMTAQAKPLTRAEIRSLAEYYASLDGTLEARR